MTRQEEYGSVASGEVTLEVGSMLGPLYIGIPASTLVYGVTCCQTFYYYRSEQAKRDHWTLRTLVATLMILTFLQEAFVVAVGYNSFVTNYANPCRFLGKIYWSFPAEKLINGILQLFVEGFLIHRTYRLSRNIYTAAFCGILLLAGAALSIAVPIQLFISKANEAANLLDSQTLTEVSKGVVVLGDACNTAAMIFYLHKSRTGFHRSEMLITKLVTLTISTGALTAVVSLGDFLGVLLSTQTVAILCFEFIVGKLYVNVLLTLLSMRGSILLSSAEASAKANSAHRPRLQTFNPYNGGVPAQQFRVDVESVVVVGSSETKTLDSPGSSTISSSPTLRDGGSSNLVVL